MRKIVFSFTSFSYFFSYHLHTSVYYIHWSMDLFLLFLADKGLFSLEIFFIGSKGYFSRNVENRILDKSRAAILFLKFKFFSYFLGFDDNFLFRNRILRVIKGKVKDITLSGFFVPNPQFVIFRNNNTWQIIVGYSAVNFKPVLFKISSGTIAFFIIIITLHAG